MKLCTFTSWWKPTGIMQLVATVLACGIYLIFMAIFPLPIVGAIIVIIVAYTVSGRFDNGPCPDPDTGTIPDDMTLAPIDSIGLDVCFVAMLAAAAALVYMIVSRVAMFNNRIGYVVAGIIIICIASMAIPSAYHSPTIGVKKWKISVGYASEFGIIFFTMALRS
jgi:hypothetical protein